MGGAGSGIARGLGVGLLSTKVGCLWSVWPLLLGFPLLFLGLSLEGTNWDVSWEECDLWQSRAGADHWWGTSLQCLVVMQAIYRLITVLWVPERNVAGCWGGPWLLC